MTHKSDISDQTSKGWLTSGLVLLASMLAIGLRIVPWRNFIDSTGTYLFYGPDSYDHLRRIALGLAKFPHIPMFDSYYGYPVGTGFIWSPFFDYFITCITLVCGGETATAHLIGFWISPLLGGATVIALYCAVARLFGSLPAMAAAFFLAVLPGHILYTLVSELDHHSVEPLLAIAVLVSVSRLKSGSDEASGRIPQWLMVALVFVGSLMLWRGSVIFWVMGIGGMALQIWAFRSSGSHNGSRLGSQGVMSCLAAATILVPLCLLFGGTGGSGIKFNIVSWFHVILLLCSAAGLYFLSRNDLFRLSPKIMLSSLAALLILAATVGRGFIAGLFSGLRVVGRGDPWLDSISELRSMLFPSGGFELMHSLETLSPVYWLFPVILWRIYSTWRKSGDLQTAVFLVWSLALWLMPLFRERYVHLAALPVAIGAGYAANELRQSLIRHKGPLVAYSGSAALMLILAAPVAPFMLNLKNVRLPDKELTDLPEALRYLRDKTPLTSNYAEPSKLPEYGVLSEWGLGAYICYLAQRPTVATNFGWETHGLYESVTVLTTSDPLLAEDIMAGNKIRYLLLSDVTGSLPNFRSIAESEKSTYKAVLRRNEFKPLATIYYRLYIQDGSAFNLAGLDLPALSSYRLVHETPNGSPDPVVGSVSHYKVFEKVKGALIKGTAAPATRVSLESGFRTGTGRIMTYRDWTDADTGGRYVFRMPYATTGNNGDLVPMGPCTVTAGGRHIKVQVKENDVITGLSKDI